LPDEAIRGITPLTTGFSNETYLVEGPDLILRLPPASGAMLDGHDVIAQASIYESLYRLAGGPPVPKVVLTCKDTSVIGAPFFLMERIPGESVHDLNPQEWFTRASDASRSEMCRLWISGFARLAQTAPLEVLGRAMSPEDDASRWRRFAQDANSPQLVDMFDRLLSRPAPLSGPPAIVHGDTKLSNVMWHDFKIAAVLDWEMALNGEPLSDLGYLLYSFESPHHRGGRAQKLSGMYTREQVISQWREVSGRTAEGVEWHEIAQLGKICAIIAEGVNMYVTGRSADPKLAYFQNNLDYFMGVMDAMLNAGDY
jgi:aminoglycoside phosphotransferase (APT) family kinase protein